MKPLIALASIVVLAVAACSSPTPAPEPAKEVVVPELAKLQAAARSDDPAWQPRPGLDRPSLLELWGRSDQELAGLIRGSALSRAGVSGLRRNLAVALGNSGGRL